MPSRHFAPWVAVVASDTMCVTICGPVGGPGGPGGPGGLHGAKGAGAGFPGVVSRCAGVRMLCGAANSVAFRVSEHARKGCRVVHGCGGGARSLGPCYLPDPARRRRRQRRGLLTPTASEASQSELCGVEVGAGDRLRLH